MNHPLKYSTSDNSSKPILPLCHDSKVNFYKLQALYREKSPITSLVLNDSYGADLARQAGIEILVIGFSHGGPFNTPTENNATLVDTIQAIERVKSKNDYAYLIADIPLLNYESDEALLSAARAVKAAGVDAVKLEGGAELSPVMDRLNEEGIPIIGHVGYTPKTGAKMRLRGTTLEDYQQLWDEAMRLVRFGVKGLVFEMIRSDAATLLSYKLSVPTIGIYSGPGTSGQALVLNDLLDLTHFDPAFFPKGKPKSIGNWYGSPQERVHSYFKKVKSGEFPFQENFIEKTPLTTEEMWDGSGACHYR